MLLLFVSLTGIGFAIGAMNVWSIAMAKHHHQDMLSGIIPAAFSTGSFLGGLIYGSRTWSGSPTRRLIIATAAFLAGWLPLFALPGPYAVTVPGAFLTIVVACAYITTDALTPAGRTSEAYAWLILAIGAGSPPALPSRDASPNSLSPALRSPPLARPSLWLSFSPRADVSAPPDSGSAAGIAARSEAGTRRPDQGATPLLSNPLRRSVYGRPYAVDRGARLLPPGGS